MSWRSLTIIAFAGSVLLGCGDAEAPYAVAEQFWAAMVRSDTTEMRALILSTDTVDFSDVTPGEEVGSFTLGEPALNGEQATIPTTLAAGPDTITFDTQLSVEAEQWRVNLSGTFEGMFRAVLGMSAEEFGEQLGEALVEGMQAAVEEAAAEPEPDLPTPLPSTPQIASFAEEPWFPADTGTIEPGFTGEEVIAVWGEPLLQRRMGNRTYMYYRNGCERACGIYDLVMLQGNQVIDAIVRGRGHTYAGVSSSPPGRLAEFTPPTASPDTSGAIG